MLTRVFAAYSYLHGNFHRRICDQLISIIVGQSTRYFYISKFLSTLVILLKVNLMPRWYFWSPVNTFSFTSFLTCYSSLRLLTPNNWEWLDRGGGSGCLYWTYSFTFCKATIAITNWPKKLLLLQLSCRIEGLHTVHFSHLKDFFLQHCSHQYWMGLINY